MRLCKCPCSGSYAAQQLTGLCPEPFTLSPKPYWAHGRCYNGAGSMLIMPSGLHQRDRDAPPVHAAHVYKRGCWASPLFTLPSVKVRQLPVQQLLLLLLAS